MSAINRLRNIINATASTAALFAVVFTAAFIAAALVIHLRMFE